MKSTFPDTNRKTLSDLPARVSPFSYCDNSNAGNINTTKARSPRRQSLTAVIDSILTGNGRFWFLPGQFPRGPG